ncbi:unnamed protein product [Microthlaspi erraticum]|uniref:Uncharacterized protein n=1 Tax=Microthlaspi erraticum TaxID=1685480 RepID=A0A6D2L8M4_9BRAS|nr:unnamed protein product [Microthlaspi erraticum]
MIIGEEDTPMNRISIDDFVSSVQGKISSTVGAVGGVTDLLWLVSVPSSPSSSISKNKDSGFPVWLKYIPGISFRTDNGPLKCRLELEHSSPNTERPPLVFVEESDCWRFIKTVRVLAEIFKNNMVNETTRQSIVQVLMNPITPPERNTDAMHFFLTSIGKLSDFQFSDQTFKQQFLQSSWAVELESNYNEEVKLRKEAQVALARETEDNELMKRLLESYKEEQG